MPLIANRLPFSPTCTSPFLDVEKIELLRFRAGMSVGQAATAVGYRSAEFWECMVRDRTNITLNTLHNVARSLGVRPADLLK